MKVSRRALYGIMAAIDLAIYGKEVPVQARSIARRQAIPIKFLEQVLLAMKKGGLIHSLRGAQGGYRLVKEPSALSVADILEVLDGPVFYPLTSPLASNGFPAKGSQSKQELLLGHIWKQVAQAEHEVLQRIRIDQLAEQQQAIEGRYIPMYHI
ncbi:MAG: Rrf2 family transcriptional regulator [Nitrospira sp.]|nr:Rrf2 family transcriptional regulator [Nitrospira sp.]MCP9441686.1 Rrf2 family transcriptional regulator [Nitrospira sp.]